MRSTFRAWPARTRNDAGTGATAPSPSASLKRTFSQNAASPSCSAGAPSNAAVSGGPARATVTA